MLYTIAALSSVLSCASGSDRNSPSPRVKSSCFMSSSGESPLLLSVCSVDSFILNVRPLDAEQWRMELDRGGEIGRHSAKRDDERHDGLLRAAYDMHPGASRPIPMAIGTLCSVHYLISLCRPFSPRCLARLSLR